MRCHARVLVKDVKEVEEALGLQVPRQSKALEDLQMGEGNTHKKAATQEGGTW